ncbi:hypothetical protein AN1V17_47850 [Vallitalea sediminicola]
MLAILLGILKIFLYIILFIILFVVLCILTVLFVPIRYSAQGEKYDTIKLDVKVNWLLHIVSFKYHMDDETNMSLKIFGKDIMAEKKHKKVKKANNKKHKKKHKKKQKGIKSDNRSKDIDDPNGINKEAQAKMDNEKIQYNIGIEKENDQIVEGKEETQEDKHKMEKFKNKVEESNKKNKSSKIAEHKNKKKKKKEKKDKAKKRNWKQIYSTIKDFIKNEENRDVLKKIKVKVLKMIKHILPKKFQSKLLIGTGDPASTGYLVGAASVLYTITGNKLKVIPDFNEKIFQGCFYGKGKIYLIVLLKNTISIVLDKRVRKIYKVYKR